MAVHRCAAIFYLELSYTCTILAVMKAKDNENGPRLPKTYRLDEGTIADIARLAKKLKLSESETVEYAVRELKIVWIK